MLNKDNLKYFNQPQEADNWVWRIENGISDWVNRKGRRGNGDKSYWKLVFWVSQTHLRILIPNMSLPEFAQFMIEEFPNAFRKRETKDTLFHSMEKFEYNRHLSDFDNQHNTYVSNLVSEVEVLLTKDVEKPTETGPTLELRMKEFAENAMATGSYDKVCVRPNYNGVSVSLSVERYVSQKFRDENRPSSIIIFECVYEKVTENEVYVLNGKFASLPNKKLYIASTVTFPRSTIDVASTHNMGLVLVNLQYKVDEHCFVLPRSPERKDYLYWRQMHSGEINMTVPFIACDSNPEAADGVMLYFSMKDLLRRNHIPVKRDDKIKAPVLYNDDIEAIALNCVKAQVDSLVSTLEDCGDNDPVPECVIDPYKLAETMGLQIVKGNTGEERALIDIGRRTVTISSSLPFDFHCTRFDMSHEDGHYVLHYDVMALAKERGLALDPSEKGWLEQQANHFASCLLMPAPVISRLFYIYMKRSSVQPCLCPLPAGSCCVRECIIAPVARKMNVSVEAATIRLKKMGLVCESQLLPRFLPAS